MGEEGRSWGERGDAAMTHEELLNGRPARISTRSTNGTPRTTCGAVWPSERNPTGMYQTTAGFTGRAPVSAPAGVPWTHRLGRFVFPFFVFVIGRSTTQSQQPRRGARGGGRTWSWTQPRARDRLARPCERSIWSIPDKNGPYARTGLPGSGGETTRIQVRRAAVGLGVRS